MRQAITIAVQQYLDILNNAMRERGEEVLRVERYSELQCPLLGDDAEPWDTSERIMTSLEAELGWEAP